MQGPECKTLFENLPECVKENGEQLPIAASSMIRSHSVSGDLHGVQPDPIAADILRKEPEQETFARLKITPMGIDFLSSFLDMHILACIACFCIYIKSCVYINDWDLFGHDRY